jgi:hypothetical protein
LTAAAAAAAAQSKHKINRYASYAINFWKRLLNYRSFNRPDKQKLTMSEASVVFSQYLSNLICGDNNGSSNNSSRHYCCEVIYHGAEPSSKIHSRPSKKMQGLGFPYLKDRESLWPLTTKQLQRDGMSLRI